MASRRAYQGRTFAEDVIVARIIIKQPGIFPVGGELYRLALTVLEQLWQRDSEWRVS